MSLSAENEAIKARIIPNVYTALPDDVLNALMDACRNEGRETADPAATGRAATIKGAVEASKDWRHRAEAAEARVKALTSVLKVIKSGATAKCPCGPPDYAVDEPKICPLCRADVDNPNDRCMAIEQTIPRHILTDIEAALLST